MRQPLLVLFFIVSSQTYRILLALLDCIEDELASSEIDLEARDILERTREEHI